MTHANGANRHGEESPHQRLPSMIRSVSAVLESNGAGEISWETCQDLMALAIHVYTAKVEHREHPDEPPPLPLRTENPVTPTSVAIVTTKLLESADIAIFELEMWRSLSTY